MAKEPHGDKYLYISEWLSKKMTGDSKNYVPYIVDSKSIDYKGNLRKQFNIPDEHIVISSYGGKNVFDIPFVKEAIKEVLDLRNDIVFMFLNNEFISIGHDAFNCHDKNDKKANKVYLFLKDNKFKKKGKKFRKFGKYSNCKKEIRAAPYKNNK